MRHDLIAAIAATLLSVPAGPALAVSAPGLAVAADAIAPPPKGLGQIVFFRRGTFIGAAISCAVHEDGIKLTSLPPGKFAAVNVLPGIHNFIVASEATDVMRVDVQAGQTYYGVCLVQMGMFAGRPTLTPVDHATFFAMAPKLKPAKAMELSGPVLAQTTAIPVPVPTMVAELAPVSAPVPIAVPAPAPAPLPSLTLVAAPVTILPAPASFHAAVATSASPATLLLPVVARVVVARPLPPAMTAGAETAAEPSRLDEDVTLPANTEIWLTPIAELSSRTLRQGDTFVMHVSRDVYVGRDIVVPHGTAAVGRVAYRTGRAAFGKSAKMEFELVKLSLGGGDAALTGRYRVEGRGNTGATVALIFTFWPASPFIIGHSATVAANSEWRAYTSSPLHLALNGGDGRDRRRERTAMTETRLPPENEHIIPLNSSYRPAPAEMLIRTLPAQP